MTRNTQPTIPPLDLNTVEGAIAAAHIHGVQGLKAPEMQSQSGATAPSLKTTAPTIPPLDLNTVEGAIAAAHIHGVQGLRPPESAPPALVVHDARVAATIADEPAQPVPGIAKRAAAVAATLANLPAESRGAAMDAMLARMPASTADRYRAAFDAGRGRP
jgi:hypothetical protein